MGEEERDGGGGEGWERRRGMGEEERDGGGGEGWGRRRGMGEGEGKSLITLGSRNQFDFSEHIWIELQSFPHSNLTKSFSVSFFQI